jgi:hypothetical protein
MGGPPPEELLGRLSDAKSALDQLAENDTRLPWRTVLAIVPRVGLEVLTHEAESLRIRLARIQPEDEYSRRCLTMATAILEAASYRYIAPDRAMRLLHEQAEMIQSYSAVPRR